MGGHIAAVLHGDALELPLAQLRLEGVFFHRDIEQAIEWVQFNNSFVPRNTGQAEARGYELRGSLALWNRLELGGNYTYLDTEIKSNGWLHVAADSDLVFGPDLGAKWGQAMDKIGIDPRMLSEDAGHA